MSRCRRSFVTSRASTASDRVRRFIEPPAAILHPARSPFRVGKGLHHPLCCCHEPEHCRAARAPSPFGRWLLCLLGGILLTRVATLTYVLETLAACSINLQHPQEKMACRRSSRQAHLPELRSVSSAARAPVTRDVLVSSLYRCPTRGPGDTCPAPGVTSVPTSVGRPSHPDGRQAAEGTRARPRSAHRPTPWRPTRRPKPLGRPGLPRQPFLGIVVVLVLRIVTTFSQRRSQTGHWPSLLSPAVVSESRDRSSIHGSVNLKGDARDR
jgi:hypothetical protein